MTPKLCEKRDKTFFTKFEDLLLEQAEGNMHIAGGDFNTRLHGRLRGEGDVIGQYIFGRGEKFIRTLSRDNREHRKNLLPAYNARIMIFALRFS